MAKETEEQIEKAVRLLRAGTPVAIPTETVYGLAAPIDNPEAIAQIFRLKERPFFDPLIVHVTDDNDLQSVVSEISPAARLLMDAFWPGPLTIVLPKHEKLNPMICSGLETVGVRMPAHPVAREIIQRTGVPLAAPSANKFGKVSPTDAEHVRSEWPNGEVFVVDAGPSEHGLESTVVRINLSTAQTIVEVLRPGVVKAGDIADAFWKTGAKVKVARVASEASPGNIKHHYMPAVPMIVVPAEWLPLDKRRMKEIADTVAIDFSSPKELILADDPVIAARELYSQMRELSASGATCLIYPKRSELHAGLWEAIWDRVSRAATKVFS